MEIRYQKSLLVKEFNRLSIKETKSTQVGLADIDDYQFSRHLLSQDQSYFEFHLGVFFAMETNDYVSSIIIH